MRKRIATPPSSPRAHSGCMKYVRASLYVLPLAFVAFSAIARGGDGVGTIGTLPTIATLGVAWSSSEDKFHREVAPPEPFRMERRLPFAPNHELLADFLFNSSTGSFWLPRPPSDAVPREAGHEGNTSSLVSGYDHHHSEMPHGFMHPDKVTIHIMSGYNAGDFLAVYLAPMISGRYAEVDELFKPPKANRIDPPALAVVGSILHRGATYSWGAGFITPQDPIPMKMRGIFAVRGPVSVQQWNKLRNIRQKYSSKEIPTIPNVYGDAGTLISWYYQPHDQTPKYDLCIFPHYIQKSARFVKDLHASWPSGKAHILDIDAPIFDIMDELVRCDFVLSSTLHGIIFADSYGIPNGHYRQSNEVAGGFYKFDDYYQSINRTRLSLRIPAESAASQYPSDPQDRLTASSAWKEMVGRVQQFVQSEHQAYQFWSTNHWASIDRYDYWASCPMHAEAYNRTRAQHTQFAMAYARAFSSALKNRSKHFFTFQNDVHNATEVLLQKGVR